MFEQVLGAIVLVLLVLPTLAATFLVFAKSDAEVGRVKRIQDWVRLKYETLSPERVYNKYCLRPSLWVLKPIATQTDKITNPHWSAAAWVFVTGYIALFLLFVMLSVGWALIVFALFIGALMLVFALLGESSDEDDYEPRRERFAGMPPKGGRSIEREGFLGKYTEHQDADGNVIGESREQEGFFGAYTEHRDLGGNVVGESREQEGFLGAYTEHRDLGGNVVGESREQEGFLGDYTEHRDADGNLLGESRKRKGFFDDYIEHEEK